MIQDVIERIKDESIRTFDDLFHWFETHDKFLIIHLQMVGGLSGKYWNIFH